ncbi:MAG: AraC family transcriptional regulator [Caldilineaceae bacterium]
MGTEATQQNLYQQRIDAVISYVRENLDAELSLETLAKVANFSPFHFHRIFKALTEETINDMVVRLRLERAASLLRGTPQLSVTDAAFVSGFNSVATFSRSFKKRYGVAASTWDRQTPLKNSKIDQHPEGLPRYTATMLGEFAAQDAYRVTLRSLPTQRLATIRVYDAYSHWSQIVSSYERLLAWFCRQGGQLAQTTLYGMSQDDPEITPLRLCRFDWCLSVPAHWQTSGEVNVIDFPACQVATIPMTGDATQEDRILQYLFRYWLPRSRYQPANLPAMEIYRRQPAELGWETFDIDCAIPIVAL